MKIERNQLRSDIFPWHCSELKKKLYLCDENL